MEQELLSSTSEEVCELWGRTQVNRVQYNPDDWKIKDLVLWRPRDGKPHDIRIMSAHQAVREDVIHLESDRDNYHDFEEPPSIALNVPGSCIARRERRFWAWFGFFMHILTLTVPAIATFHFRWPRKGQPVSTVSYLLFASGTELNMLGMFLCGLLIDRFTDETEYSWEDDDERTISAVIQMQVACTANSKNFPSCAILLGSDNKRLRISRKALERIGRYVVNLLGTRERLMNTQAQYPLP